MSSKVKDAILRLLKMQGAQTAAELAEQLDVSPMAVRQHLQSWQAEGWVTYREEKRSMGRPVKLWQLTEQSARRFPDSHADLMVDLLRGVESVFGSDGLERLVCDRSQRQIQHYQAQIAEKVAGADWRDRLQAIAQLRSQEGYMAEALPQSDKTWLLIENHCPIYAAAQTCQGFCSAELEVFRTLLGEDISIERIEHLMGGDRRCAYQISATPKP